MTTAYTTESLMELRKSVERDVAMVRREYGALMPMPRRRARSFPPSAAPGATGHQLRVMTLRPQTLQKKLQLSKA
jgi:hypothetical protein